MPDQPIDPLSGPRYALAGKVVTMDPQGTVLNRGVVYIDQGQIVAVQPNGDPAPPGFEEIVPIRTGGTLYPGLIELHNHLSYNILPLWTVPKRFGNRAQWRDHPDKQKLVTGPMQVLGKTADYVPAIVRYVEAKCLLAGVTTSQGFTLTGVLGGIKRYYRGLTRNVESTADPALPAASTKVDDVAAKNRDAFFQSLKDKENASLLLHLSEGSDPAAHSNFEALQFPNGEWAVTPALAGIHCVPLTAQDYQVMAAHGGSLVWSPLSNLLLYGQTADVQAAKQAGVLISLGSDWSPSGSKNLLGELKVAYLVSEALGGVFTKQELLALVTVNPARILKWDRVLGSLEAGKRADLLVVRGQEGDPYDRLLGATEKSIRLVVINGVPRYGEQGLMAHFGDGFEEWTVGGQKRLLYLKQATADPVLGVLTLAQARDRLRFGLQNLAALAQPLDDGSTPLAALANMGRSFDDPRDAVAALAGLGFATHTTAAGEALLDAGPDLFARPVFFLELDQDGLAGESQRPLLPDPLTGELTGFPSPLDQGAVHYAELLKDVRIDLDPLTIVDDEGYFQRLAVQTNLPAYLKAKLPPFYGVEPLPDDAVFVRRLDPAVRAQFDSALELATFMHTGGLLTLADRRRIADQALLLLEKTYVHLPLKRAMHAIEPIQRLKLLQYALDQQSEDNLPPEMEFHNEMTDIFTSTRDLHTNYLLPAPFQDKTAFLPFFIEEYFEGGEPHYLVSKIVGQAGPPTFKEGVEALYWNGVPIRRAVELNAERQAGSNAAARHARGLDSLTIRPLVRVLPPDEEWVTLRYRTAQGKEDEATLKWLVFSPQTSAEGIDPNSPRGGGAGAAFLGFDLQTDAIHQTKKVLFGLKGLKAAQQVAVDNAPSAESPQWMETTLPTVFRAKAAPTSHGTFGYVRLFTFNVANADAFVQEFVRLVRLLPQNGLILDVRGNGGGLIHAAERLLQVLTPHPIEPEPAQFINTPLVLELCRRHAPSPLWPDLDLGPWIESIAQAVQTGATYSRGFPLTPRQACNDLGQQYYGPVVLISDALCYSATDIFVAGFQDHAIGPILGIHGNTGAGGANVWTHDLLQVLMNDPADPYTPRPGSPFQPLPQGGGMRVAVRRTLRVGERSGTPLEDLGIVPDSLHPLTRRDLLAGNLDLIERAGELLAARLAYPLSLAVEGVVGNTLTATATTLNISRLDLFLGGRPQGSLDVGDGARRFTVELPAPRPAGEALLLELYGYAAGHLVAAARIKV